MFARVSTYRAADADKLLEGFQSVTDPLEQIDGFSHAYFLVDRASCKALSITMWESEQALSPAWPRPMSCASRGPKRAAARSSPSSTTKSGSPSAAHDRRRRKQAHASVRRNALVQPEEVHQIVGALERLQPLVLAAQ